MPLGIWKSALCCTELAQHFGTTICLEFRHRCRILRDSLAKECPSEVVFAGKALVAALCRILAQENLGLDVVSGGELYTALQSGFPAHRIFMHGNNKSQSELRMALESGVGRIVVDNFLELDQLAQLARAQHRTADILLRVTPGIEAHTHAYVKTGQVDSKFGFTMENGQALAAAKRALSLPNINLMGFHCHIGSQIFELEPFQDAAVALAELVAQTRDLTGQVLPELDLGGGFGIRYHDQERPPALDGYASAIRAGLSQACANTACRSHSSLSSPDGRSAERPALPCTVLVQSRKSPLCAHTCPWTAAWATTLGPPCMGRSTAL